ncbi:MAG: glycosyl transferase, partial [Pseudomonadota bacterium]|nr:glycosyl transferase [Pseudomonadota bacterium]
GLTVDRHTEERTAELFAENIMEAGRIFLDNPSETPFIPTWNRVHAADSSLMTDMLKAVAADLKDYG